MPNGVHLWENWWRKLTRTGILISIQSTSMSSIYLLYGVFVSQIKDGKIDSGAIKQSLANSGEKPFPNEIIEECQSITSPDRCELAVQFTDCMIKGAAAHANGPK